MNIDQILVELDTEIARLQQAKALLTNTAYAPVVVKRKPGRPPASAKTSVSAPAPKATRRRTMSAEGRAKIAAAQKARWAKTKKVVKPTAKRKPGRPPKKVEAATTQA